MRVSVALIGSLLLAAVGCKGKSASEVCTERAKVVCEKKQMCSDGFSVLRDNGTIQNCQDAEKLTCTQSSERTGSGNDPEQVEGCTAALKKQTCPDRAAGVDVPACESTGGSFKDGQSCISVNQCVSTYCDIPPGQACGKCQKRVADGMPCDASGDCVEGSYCQRPPMVVMGTCAKLGAENAACNDTLRCADGLSCAGFNRTNMIDGACRKPAATAGQPCDPTMRLCVIGLRCVLPAMALEGTCKALKAKVDEVCDNRNRADVDCDGALGYYCHHAIETNPATGMPTNSATGTCKKRVLVGTGKACGTLTDNTSVTCLAGDTCQRPIDPLTGAAQANMPGLCVARVGDTMPCNTDGNIGPGCLPGHACVLKMPGLSTEGTCRKRTYEVLCNVK